MFNYDAIKPTEIVTTVDQFETHFNSYYLSSSSQLSQVPSDTCRVWVVRHGESESNSEVNDKDKVRIAGRVVDSALSSKGKDQVNAFGSFLKPLASITSYYSSRLVRAMETAIRIKHVLDTGTFIAKDVPVQGLIQAYPIPDNEGLIETNYGLLEGATGHVYDPCEKAMNDTLPTLKSFEDRMDYVMADGMESNKQVYARVISTILEIAKRHLGQEICMATHNGPLKALLMHLAAHDEGVDLMYHKFSVGNCAALCLETDGNTVKLKYIHNIAMRKEK